MTESITLEELAQTPTGRQALAEREAQVEEAALEEMRRAKLAEFTAEYEELTATLKEADAEFADMVEDFYRVAINLREAILEHRLVRSRVNRHGGEIAKPRARHEKAYYERLRNIKDELLSLMTLP